MQTTRTSKEGYGSEKPVASEQITTRSGSTEDVTTDEYGSSDDHIFSDPAIADRWRQIFENAKYENRHRFDPSFQWTAEEELKVVKKIDWRIMSWAWLMFCAMDLHRRNINRAISDNMLEEIGTVKILPPFRCRAF